VLRRRADEGEAVRLDGFGNSTPDWVALSANGRRAARAEMTGNRVEVWDVPSGKVLLRMPRRLHAQLAQSAKQEDVSLNQYIVYLLSSAVGSRDSEQPTMPKRSTSTVA
jgi:hypothetical protein